MRKPKPRETPRPKQPSQPKPLPEDKLRAVQGGVLERDDEIL